MAISKKSNEDKQVRATNQAWNSLSPNLEDCTRCGGIMVIEHFQDLKDETGAINFLGKRCVLCGDVIDPKIEHNRLHQNQLNPGTETRTRRSAPQAMQGLSTKKGEPS